MNVINLWGAPGSGKSTTAAGLFFLMKINKFKVELVTEYAKDLVWDKHTTLFGNQIAIFSEQNRRQDRLREHGLDFIITDSPLPLPMIFKPAGYYRTFDSIVLETFHSYNNINYLLHRTSSFEKIGRIHDEAQSMEVSEQIKQLLVRHHIEHQELEANPRTPEAIFLDIQARLPKPQGMPFALPPSS